MTPTPSTPDPVVTDIDDHVASVCINRPEKRNALDTTTFAALGDIAESLADDKSVRAVVLHGAGSAFCAGLDLSLFRAFAEESAGGERPFADPQSPGSGRRNPGSGQRIVKALRAIPVPVIASVQGPAIGGGLQLALGADIRIAGPEALFSAREIHYGITLDMGGTQLLPDLVGPDRAIEMMMTGRPVDAEEALRIGLATQLADEPLESAFELARTIAGWNPDAVAATKHLVQLSRRATVEEGMAAELDFMAGNIGGPNQTEAVQAFFEQRPPRFDDRS
jgi:enoyl-CoA hydratase/carnithine racemase